MINIVTNFGSTLKYIEKTFSMVSALERAYNLRNQTRELTTSEKIDIYCHTLFACVQGLALTTAPNFGFTSIRLEAGIAVGVTDIARTTVQYYNSNQGINRGAVANIAAMAVNHTGYCTYQALEQNPQCFGNNRQLIQDCNSLLNACTSIAVLKLQKFPTESLASLGYRAFKCAQNAISTFVDRCSSLWSSICPWSESAQASTQLALVEPASTTTQNSSAPAQVNSMPASNVTAQRTDRDAEDVDIVIVASLQMLRYQTLPAIPPYFHNDTRFIYRSDITGTPIRYVVVPSIEEGRIARMPTYEAAELEARIANNPHEAPTNWPTDHLPLPLQGSYIRPCPRRQREINETLQTIAQEIRSRIMNRG